MQQKTEYERHQRICDFLINLETKVKILYTFVANNDDVWRWRIMKLSSSEASRTKTIPQKAITSHRAK